MYLAKTFRGCFTLVARPCLVACDHRALNWQVLRSVVKVPARQFHWTFKPHFPGSRQSCALVVFTLSIMSRVYNVMLEECDLPTHSNSFARKGSRSLAVVAVGPRLSVAAPTLLPLWMQGPVCYAGPSGDIKWGIYNTGIAAFQSVCKVQFRMVLLNVSCSICPTKLPQLGIWYYARKSNTNKQI